MPSSKLKVACRNLLKEEGCIADLKLAVTLNLNSKVELKYFQGKACCPS